MQTPDDVIQAVDDYRTAFVDAVMATAGVRNRLTMSNVVIAIKTNIHAAKARLALLKVVEEAPAAWRHWLAVETLRDTKKVPTLSACVDHLTDMDEVMAKVTAAVLQT